MTNFPKSIEAPITRFFHSPVSWDKGVKNGGMTAVLKLPEGEWNDVLVYQPDSPGENWWDLVPRNAVIRASIREPAKKNPKDLIAFALPLKNQPSGTQALIKSLQSDEIDQESEIGLTDGDKLEEQLKEEVLKKQQFEKLKTYLPRAQYLIKMGEWLDQNEAGLKLCQSQMADAFFEWCEDDSPTADSTLVHKTDDAFKYFIETIASLRQLCGCRNKERDGTLYLSFPDGKVETIIDVKELP
jgi:hypothetical protein